MSTTRLTISLKGPAYAWLKAEAERLEISIADLLRRIVDERRERNPTPGPAVEKTAQSSA